MQSIVGKALSQRHIERRPIPVRAIQWVLLMSFAIQLVGIPLVTFWPERSHALGPFLLLGAAVTLRAWFDIKVYGVARALFAPERLPQPDEYGFFLHPDIPDTKEDESIVSPLKALGYEAAFVGMDVDAPEALIDDYFDKNDLSAVKRWTPTRPQGEGWTLVAKYDTEDGPYAMFVRPTHREAESAQEVPA